jgi:putative FmdB family regulatory protein
MPYGLIFMPIYEFACPKCRKIFNFLSKRINPDHLPVCPKCGNKKMTKQLSRFAMTKGLKEPAAGAAGPEDGPPMPDLDDPRVERAMMEMERDMAHMDENNPKHMAAMMKKMKDILPPGTMPKELDVAIKRLEAGEDPEKIEADMGDVLGDFMGGGEGEGGPGGGYTHDSGLYDM